VTRFPLLELAARFGLDLHGDGKHEITGVGTLQDAGPNQLTFLANAAYRPELPRTRAGAVILDENDLAHCPTNALVAPDPYLAYARIAGLFDPRAVPEAGVHPSAVVDPSAKLGSDVHIGAQAVIGPGCELGDGCSIGPGSVLLPNCSVGAGSRLVARVTLCEGVRLGRRVLVHPGAVIGADGFGIAHTGKRWEKVPQVGAVHIGDDCEIGANSCIDRGAIEDTVLEEDVHIDNLCQIGHNCHVGAHTAMAAYTGISGSTRIGRNCLFAGRSGSHGHISIADGVTVGAMTMVKKTIDQPGTTWSAGFPAQPIGEWQRMLAQLRRLDKTLRRLRASLREAQAGKDNSENGQSAP
jgi:UDP-3-O-[3-hydroxymyristoyl] glucosamine N-acyltransferase